MLKIEKKNYEVLAQKAEVAFQQKEYLQAFLLQSCIFEAVIKSYASLKMAALVGRSDHLKNKFKNFELARLIDELFIAGKISKGLYEQLSAYRKRRNDVIHQILQYGDKSRNLERGLKAVYESGRTMKGSIVDDIIQSQKGKTRAEIVGELEAFLAQHKHDSEINFKRELKPKFDKMLRDVFRPAKKTLLKPK